MRVGFIAAGLAATLSWTPASASSAGDAILGYWLVHSRDAIVHITASGQGAARHYRGRLVWLKQSRYTAEDGPQRAGKLITDTHNPDPAKRNRPLLGLTIVWGLRYDPEDHEWRDGRVYNSDDGRTYHCLVRLEDQDHLILRGYIGIPLFGGSTTWTRVTGPHPPAR